MKNVVFKELRKSMIKKQYREYCNSCRVVNGFNTGTRTFSDKRLKRERNTRWTEEAYV